MSDTQNNETRDENGRFRPGASGNPHGRPPKAREQAYLDTLKERLGLEAWAEIVDKAIKDAQVGDDKARAWLSDYAIGKPKQTIAIDNRGEGGGDYERYSDDELRAIADGGASPTGTGKATSGTGGAGAARTGAQAFD